MPLMGRPRIYGDDRTASMTFSLKKSTVDTLLEMKAEGKNVSRFVNTVLEEKLNAKEIPSADSPAV